MNGLYLAVDLGVLAMPLLLSFDKRVNFFSQWKDFWPTNLAVMAFFIAWDVLFTEWGIWGFNPDYLLGPEWLGLPLEEWLFFICIPYASIFTYATIKHYVRRNPIRYSALTVSMTALAITGGITYWYAEALYTFTASALFCVFLIWIVATYAAWTHHMWVTLLVLIVPFIVTNGVLTGIHFWEYPLLHHEAGQIEDSIVWYNDVHTTGWRIFSMPADDLIYGFLLIGMHIAGFEALQKKRLGLGPYAD
tara:strand:+ start:880 stop:1623 length:744 start_codon:yes stop_codon:yes gene_type:complete